MNELELRIATLMGQGFQCSQIIMMLVHELGERENPELIRAMGGLGRGLFRRKVCGTLSGACCLLASFGARGTPGDSTTALYSRMCTELVDWFEETFDSVDCEDLVEPDRESMVAFCPGLIEQTFLRCMELLEEQGIDPATDGAS